MFCLTYGGPHWRDEVWTLRWVMMLDICVLPEVLENKESGIPLRHPYKI